ncbi:pheromone A receptor-domain-containing protein [Mycena leptocephala]|nr:pheromone A receptor-domain-containing protein [Mycena leptocephala]
MSPTVPLFSIFALLGFVLALVPLYWQFEVWNVGTIWYIFWIALSCFDRYFNSVLWAGNTVNSAPAWCEISIRIAMAASVGLPAASLCINHRLYEIASVPPAAVLSKHTKRRAIIVDSFISGLFPSLYIVLQLVVQRHRFNILEDIGCTVDLYDSLPTYFIAYTAPTLLSFGSFVYCALAMSAMSASRANLAEVLSPHKNLTPSRFLRLTGLALATLFLTIPLGLLNIAANATAAALSTQRSLWTASETNHLAVELARWMGPACALTFFALFGVAEEAREHYMRAFTAVSNAFWNTLARMGFTRPLPPLPDSLSSTTPQRSKRRPFLRLASTRFRKQAISRPIRGVSGTGSFADVSAPMPEAEAKASPISTVLTTFTPPSATSGRSFVAVTLSPTDPTKYILPPYQGWHHISNPGRDVEIVDATIEMKPLPALPRGRTLV